MTYIDDDYAISKNGIVLGKLKMKWMIEKNSFPLCSPLSMICSLFDRWMNGNNLEIIPVMDQNNDLVKSNNSDHKKYLLTTQPPTTYFMICDL